MASPKNGGDAADQAGAQPNFNVITQYLKDFSFENPNAPKSLMQPQRQPQIAIQINVNPNQLSNSDFEVALKVEGKAELSGTVLFAFDLNYAGVFRPRRRAHVAAPAERSGRARPREKVA